MFCVTLRRRIKEGTRTLMLQSTAREAVGIVNLLL